MRDRRETAHRRIVADDAELPLARSKMAICTSVAIAPQAQQIGLAFAKFMD